MAAAVVSEFNFITHISYFVLKTWSEIFIHFITHTYVVYTYVHSTYVSICITHKHCLYIHQAHPFSVFGSSFAEFTWCLRLTEVRIPNHTARDSSARLECHYALDNETLYSVKWYKDGNEFYRYVPRDMPPAQVFVLPGVSVDVSILCARSACKIIFLFFSFSLQLHNSTDSVVVLNSVNLSTTGRFRCEVSGEAPSFQTVSDHGDMIVVGK